MMHRRERLTLDVVEVVGPDDVLLSELIEQPGLVLREGAGGEVVFQDDDELVLNRVGGLKIQGESGARSKHAKV
jgi:hypothetical protein